MSEPAPLTRDTLAAHPLPPIDAGDKNARGRLLLIGGSRNTPGSITLTATAALRAGAGKVRIATEQSVAPHVALAVPEALVTGLPEGRDGGFAKSAIKQIADFTGQCDAIVAGPGMLSAATDAALAELVLDQSLPLILDAALLYALNQRTQSARDADHAPILLPHRLELAALLGCEPEEVDSEPLRCGLAAAGRYQAFVLVKGAQSHVVAPDGRAWLFAGGCPGLGVSGSGDTLAGICGGLLARGAPSLTALMWAVLLHGEAGQALSRKIGPVGFLAREIPGEVPALLPNSP